MSGSLLAILFVSNTARSELAFPKELSEHSVASQPLIGLFVWLFRAISSAFSCFEGELEAA